jgi:parvulin-like peptidyl-prolyl isomerase
MMTTPIAASLTEALHQRASNQELLPLLVSYQMMPQLLCESIIDRAITGIDCTSEEIDAACQQLYQQWNLVTAAQQQMWRSYQNLNQEQFEALATRSLRIEKFKQATWRHKLESYFLQRKPEVDQVIYSLLRTQNKDIAQELFFRIAEGEESFSVLVQQYSEGAEMQTGGLIGPVPLGTLNSKLAELLHTMQLGEVAPFSLGGWYMIVRLEKYLPAQLDQTMRQQLLEEQFAAWLKEQLQQLPDRDKCWLGNISFDEM